MATLSERVAEEVRALLARRRMSAAALGRQLGVSQTYVWRRLEGQTPFDLNDLEQVARILEVDVTDLLPSAVARGEAAPASHLGPSNRATAERPTMSGPIGQKPRPTTRPGAPAPATRRRPVSIRPGNRPIAA